MVPVSDALSPSPAAAPAPAWSLRVEGVSIRRGWRRVVDGFSWQHRPGRIAWVVGENGAGKSSLLRVLAGRSRPSAGRVRLSGPPGGEHHLLYFEPAMRPPIRPRIADWDRLIAALSVGRRAWPVPPALLPGGLRPDQALGRLSTGEAKRLLLGALLARGAPCIVLDEPYEHLSGGAKEALTDTLVERARSCIVIVATNQEVPRTAGGGPVLRLDGERVEILPAMEVVR